MSYEKDTQKAIANASIENNNRNLFRESGNFSRLPSNYINNGGGISLDYNNLYNGFPTIRTSLPSGISNSNWYSLENGVDYTYSFMLKANAPVATNNLNVPVHVQAGLNNTNQGKLNYYNTEGQTYSAQDVGNWKRMYVTFRLNSDANSARFLVYSGLGSNLNINVTNFKLEKGNRATEWEDYTDEYIQTGNTAIYVKDTLGNTQPLNTKLFNEFRINQKISGDFTLQMTTVKAYNNPGANILDSQSVIHVNGYNFVVKMYSENAYTKTVTAVNEYFENNKHQVLEVYNGVNTLEAQLQFALANTGWILQIDPTIANIRQPIEDLGNDNTVALVERIKEAHGVEYLIRPNNVIYFAREIGPDNQFVYRYKANINDVVLQQDTTNLTTFIRGTGANGITATYTSPNVSQFGVLEAEPFSDERFTSVQTLTDKLQTLITDTPQIVISSSIPDLTLRDIGERIWINYEPLNINFKARIIEQNLTLRNNELVSTNIIFGNIIYSSLSDSFVAQQKSLKDTQKAIQNARVDYNNKFEEAARNVEELIQIAANGKNTIFTRTTEPPRGSAIEGDLWFRPLGNGETQQYQFIGGLWVLINDTSDLTAVQREVEQAIQDTQSAIDAANQADVKADEALNNANTAINNAQTAFDNAQEALDREFRPRNLARFTNTNRFASLNTNGSVSFPNTIYNNYVSAKITALTTTGQMAIYQNSDSRLMELEQGETYTLSYKARANFNAQMDYNYIQATTGGNQLLSTNGNDINLPGNEVYKEFKVQFVFDRVTQSTNGLIIGTTSSRNVGQYLEIKDIAVYKGENIFDWNAAPEDDGYEFSQIKVSNNAIAARVGNAEGNITNLTITSQGLQTQVNGKVDNTTYNSYVTQTNQAIQARITATEADSKYATQTTVTATNNAILTRIGNIENNSRNLFQESGNFSRVTPTYINNGGGISLDYNNLYNDFPTIRTSLPNGIATSNWYALENGVDYTYSFMLKSNLAVATNNLNVPVHVQAGLNNTNQGKITFSNVEGQVYSAQDIGKWKRMYVTFRLTSDANSARFFVYSGLGSNLGINVTNFKLQKGSIATEWEESPEYISSQFVQLQDNINLKVNKNDVVNQINVSTEGILIAANRIRITGQTVIDDASIQSSKIVSLNADKINAGTLNAANVNITNLNASNITTGSLNVARLGAGQIVGNTLKTSNTQNYVNLENQFIDFYNDNLSKMRFGFSLNTADNTYFPRITMGSGDVNGRNIASIFKTTQGLNIQYTIPNSAGGGTSYVDLEDDGEISIGTPKNILMLANTIELSQAAENIGYVKSRTNGLELTRSTTQPSRIVVRLNGTDLGYLQIL